MKKILSFILIISNSIFAEEIFLSVTKEGVAQKFLPSNTVVITEKEIIKTKAKNVGELLDMLTTLDVPHYGTLGSAKNIRIRNSTADQVLILLNGMPISGVGKKATNLSLIPIESVERIEIIQGSCSGLYGANAVGGVVNIITKKAQITKPVSLSLSYGSFNTYNLVASAEYTSNDFSFILSGINKHSDGWRKNSNYDTLSGYGSFSVPVLKGQLSFDSIVVRSKLGVAGPATVPMSEWDGEKEKEASTPYAKQYDDLYIVRLGYEDKIFSSKILFNSHKLLYDNSQDPISWEQEKTDSKLYTINFLNTVSLPYKFFVSLNFEWTQIDQQYLLNPKDNFKKDVSNLGVVLQKEFKYANLNVIPTIRWDSNSLFGDRISPQLMFTFNYENTKFSLSVGSSWRAPTFLDLYWPDQIFLKGNSNLKPEVSYSVDLGVERNFELVIIGMNYFYRYIKDQIRWYSADQIVWTPSNVDQAIAQGVEISCKINPITFFNNKLSILISDNKIRKKGEEEKGWQKQAYSPVVTAVLYSDFSLPFDINLINNIKGVDAQYSSDNESGTKLEGFVLWNIRIQKNILNFANLYIQVNDLLDQKGINRAGYPQPGRNYEAGFNVNIMFK